MGSTTMDVPNDNADDLKVAQEFSDTSREQKIPFDVTLVTDDNVEIGAHKEILSRASRYFSKIFTNTKFDKNRLHIKDFDSSTLELVIQYTYTKNSITMNANNVEVILRAADYFCMEILKNNCIDFLRITMVLQNCLQYRSMADLYNCTSFLTYCDDFIKEHFTEVMKDDRFPDLAFNGLSMMIQDDNLNVPSEMAVYTAIINWVKYDLEKRQGYLYTLLSYVRLYFLDEDRFIRLLFLEPLFKRIPDVQQSLLYIFAKKNFLSSTSSNTSDKHVLVPRISYSSIPSIFTFCHSTTPYSVNYLDVRSKMWHSARKPCIGLCEASAVLRQNEIHFISSTPSCGTWLNSPVFNIKTEQWSAIQNLKTEWKDGHKVYILFTMRTFHAAVVLNDGIYMIGGIGPSGSNILSSVDYLYLSNGGWATKQITKLEEPRKYVAAAVLNGKIYVVGVGSSDEPCNTVDCYDPDTSTWKRCKNMNYGRYGAAVSVANNLFYVVGGRDIDNFGDKVEAYDPMTDDWTLMPTLPLSRQFHGVCHNDGFLFVVGGMWNGLYIPFIDVFCCMTKIWFTIRTGQDVPRSVCEVNKPPKYFSVVMAHRSS